MSRRRAIVALLALVLALPSAAFAQGAGDEQYQDPFGGEQTQGGGGGGGGQDDGLSDEPPVPGGGGGDQPAPPPQEPGGGDEPAGAPKALPNTGSDPRVLAFVGLVFVMAGVGLRLRTIDPDAY
ncbi:MAG TPA: LPXTG cell wall anchor domain-containing protein [Solirubrobacteraceae bacterium]|nr:LPXTG cell wall anchor domain-containing protein [Solirubrobacteraceae bacterium]